MPDDQPIQSRQEVDTVAKQLPATPDASQDTGSSSSLPFGADLEPVLRRACEHRLSPVRWFRTEWQHGGALTGYSTYRTDDGADHPVVVKLPVHPNERLWLIRLQPDPDVVPKVYREGDCLNGYDIAWVVMEQLPHGPLSNSWNGSEFDLLVEAVGRFYTATNRYEVDLTPPQQDWEQLLSLSRSAIKRRNLQHDKRWIKALKQAQRKLDAWTRIWSDRPTDHWCHGDLHLANAMTRVPPPDGPAVLLDLALTHPGHWVEDAVYLEHQYWSRREKLDGRKICQMIARQRRNLGLSVDKNWSHLAAVRRALLALRTPIVRRFCEDPPHLLSCLEMLEKEVTQS